MKKILIAFASMLLISGCAVKPYWTVTDDLNNVVKSTSFQMTVPEGWVRTTEPNTWERVEIDDEMQTLLLESMVVTKDGTGIHAVSITRRYPDTAFPTIKKKSNTNMLPLETADLYVSELRKRNGLERLKVLSNKPAKFGGKEAFELIMQYKNDDGLRIRITSYGFVDKTGFYTVNYRAPYLYYYERDLNDFKKLLSSFKQLEGAFEPPPEIPAWAQLFT